MRRHLCRVKTEAPEAGILAAKAEKDVKNSTQGYNDINDLLEDERPTLFVV
jgi:hypothetical protein